MDVLRCTNFRNVLCHVSRDKIVSEVIADDFYMCLANFNFVLS
jgi:hypothetical protein